MLALGIIFGFTADAVVRRGFGNVGHGAKHGSRLAIIPGTT